MYFVVWNHSKVTGKCSVPVQKNGNIWELSLMIPGVNSQRRIQIKVGSYWTSYLACLRVFQGIIPNSCPIVIFHSTTEGVVDPLAPHCHGDWHGRQRIRQWVHRDDTNHLSSDIWGRKGWSSTCKDTSYLQNYEQYPFHGTQPRTLTSKQKPAVEPTSETDFDTPSEPYAPKGED